MTAFSAPLRRFATASFLMIAALAAGCAKATEPAGPASRLNALPRPLSAAELGIRDASNGFAFTLFERLNAAGPGENVFVSPLSISMSLGMVLNGAGGATRDQMRHTLGFGESELGAVQAGYRDLSALLRGLDPATSFQIANSIWYAQHYPFLPAFLDAGRTYFDAEIRGVDFADAEGTKRAVNDWVRTRTNGRIPTILEQVRPDDVMYLINAIWFKGSWRSRFDKARTHDAAFTKADGARQTVRMMSQEVDTLAGFRYFADATVEAGELPYGNGAFAFTVLMPPRGTSVDAFAAALTPERWNAIVGNLRDQSRMVVELPKFTVTYKRELKDDLIALGMPDAFDPGRADLTGMAAGGGLYVGFVTHKAFIAVDEDGTEAAAVTNSGIREVSMPAGFHVDRAFVFAIRERLSGTVLFIGKVAAVP